MSYHKEYLPCADTSLISGNYQALQVLAHGGFDSVPMNSALKLHTTEDGNKFFAIPAEFQAREDSVRIIPPAKTPVNVGVHEFKQIADSTGQEVAPIVSGDYQFSKFAYSL